LKVLNQVGKKALQFMGARPRFDSKYLTRCIDGSLRRLRRDRIDVFYLHDPPLEAVLREEWKCALMAAKAAGKVDQCGVSSPSKEILFAAAQLDCCDILQIPLHATHAVALAVRQPIVVNHVFGDIVNNSDVESISKALGLDSRSTLIAHAVSRPGVQYVLSGTRDASHLRANVRAANIDLPAWANDSLARLFAT
jgi:aryl-alcohol dehydrogenase-like predicted oxidoreductase